MRGIYSKIFSFVILPLLIGVGIYILLRGFGGFIDSRDSDNALLNFLKYNLPDGFWFLAMLYALNIIWGKEQQELNYWTYISLILVLLTEVLQKANLLPGTYDIADIVIYIFAFLTFKITEVHFKKIKLYEN